MSRRKPASTHGLFAEPQGLKPLAERMRPRSLDEIVGQTRLLDPGKPLRRAIEAGHVHSMILWGPPGCGKTTLALLLARYAEAEFRAISAVLSGLADVRVALEEAAANFARGVRTVLFVDEVHRFNKAQQDAFLPHIEKGVILFIGATTENPSFELNSALLSRCRVHVMEAVSATDIQRALERALHDAERGLGGMALRPHADALGLIAQAADGDVRRALTLLEIAAELADGGVIDEVTLAQVLADRTRRFDKGGEQFYDQISALHKSVRSSDADAALYWVTRMMDGGCDPAYLARRLTRMAIEDVGLADPRALSMALEAWNTYDRLGSPEGDLALAQVAVYLAVAAKSNAVYVGFNETKAEIAANGTLEVPVHLRNAPTRLMKNLGYGAGYQYDHDVEGGVALDQQCLPDALVGRQFYRPTERGLEGKIAEKVNALRQAREAARSASAEPKGRRSRA
ncbi:replication-associated recombination protein A [Tahibacter amnicola]|uniref:Replication-associated recombination protein A n=1 Tax=Tahibacter amnicola TaxID=2976241 RepID=A0ABY6BJ43_9GAMM|nr:replication-associated recombination protein A [Tahibacter amnicola]UXI70028.1 replication-associated recombination protein A [Tahibacter amnicola]